MFIHSEMPKPKLGIREEAENAKVTRLNRDCR